MLIVFLTVPGFLKMVKIFSQPRPDHAPEGYDPKAWPLYLVHHAFKFNRRFGLLFLLGLVIEVVIYKIF